MRQNSYPGKIIRILLLCLCAALLAGTAAAEGAADLSDGVYIDLKYSDTLPAGRVLLAGYVDRTGKNAEPKLLCLNTDMRRWGLSETTEEVASKQPPHAPCFR